MANWKFAFLISLVMVCLLGFNANSQTSFITELELIGGPSLSSYWGKNRPKEQVAYWTYFFGGGAAHSFNHRLEINAKFLFERKGNKMDYVTTLYDENNVATTYRFIQGTELDYLTCLLNLKYYIDQKERFYGGVGGFLSSLQKSMTYTEAQVLQGGGTSYYYSQDGSYNDFDFGISAITGYRIQFRPKLFLNLQLIGNLGLSDIVKSEIPTEGPTKCFNLSLGVGFTFKP